LWKQSRGRRVHAAKRILAAPLNAPVALYRLSRRHYFPKMRGGHPLPASPGVLYVIVSWIGSLTTMSVLYGISHVTDSIMMIAPFGATCVLICAVPDSPLAQPRNIICGYLLSTAVPLILLNFLGNDWWVMVLGVATAIAVMQLTRTLHPPAGAIPMVVILTNASLSFIFTPVLIGAVILVFCGVITNNFAKDRHYPRYWW
jgi:CBS-domain-containing membrane protein